MTPTALCEHGGDPLQIQVTLFDRQHASLKLNSGQASRVPDDAAIGAKKECGYNHRKKKAAPIRGRDFLFGQRI
ncbi:MAG: hypothetical protein WA707_22175 [Pseudolabrys sp.]